jgi:Fe-S oxidoreductase/FAD/FMN-containing dehydrogenase
MIGNNSCGVHSVMGGTTADNVLELDVLTYDGTRMTLGATNTDEYSRVISRGGRPAQIFSGLKALADRYGTEIRRRFPPIPRRVSGYNLPALLPENGFNPAHAIVGSEGTCVIVLGARVRLLDSPPARSLLVLGYPDVYSAGDHVTQILEFGPVGLEGIDSRLIEDMKSVHLHPEDLKLLPDGAGWLLIEFGGETREQSHAVARRVMDALRTRPSAPTMKLFDDRDEEKLVWEIRESGLGATAHVPGKPITWEGWEDSAVPPERLGDYLRQLRALFDKYDYDGDLYGHFGQGCVHTRIDFDLTSAGGIAKYREFATEAAQLVVSFGGSISGEHGDGQSKAQLLPIMFGNTLMQAFREFKSLWDPQWRLNPGKVIDAYGLDENLRLGTGYRPVEVETHFRYPQDEGRFARALLRCVGVGNCRKHDAGTMCPSYMATREEQHSTRGRARLLFEAMQGNVLTRGWQDENVREALDLCLSCKGCRSECPVHVDMATLKAEFLSHYYEGRRRPRQAYVFGLIDRWARAASLAPQVANFFMERAPFAAIAKLAAGIAPQRSLPQFSRRTFLQQFHHRTASSSGRRVLLWADTFNNHWHAQTLLAAVDVLERAGCEVQVPRRHLCCGRPLYEFGMLDQARAYLERILDALADDIAAGTPLIVLEPACAGVFRDELLGLLPHDERAQRLSRQTLLLSEFLCNHMPGYAPVRLSGTALVHGHCIHKSIFRMTAEEQLLKQTGLEVKMLDSGCCGMAGSFGFDRRKYDVSMKIGERVLLPAVRNADEATLIIADGYSCREQIAQATGRRALHVAEVLAGSIVQEPLK